MNEARVAKEGGSKRVARREFLRRAGLLGAALTLPLENLLSVEPASAASVALLGVYCGNNWAGTNLGQDALNTLDVEQNLWPSGRPGAFRGFAAQRIYSTWPSIGVPKKLKDAAAAGRVPYTEIAPDGSNATWTSIAAGKNDAYITAQAEAYKGWWSALATPPSAQFYFAFQHEPDTESAVMGTPADFQAAFARFTRIWRSVGVPCLFVFGQTKSSWGRSPSKYMPDPSTYDIVVSDAYNKGPAFGAKWRSFQALHAPAQNWAAMLGKSFGIGETGCAENPSDASGVNSKAAWYSAAAQTVATWPNSTFVCFTHKIQSKGPDYRCDSSPQAAQAFSQIGVAPVFV